MAIQTINIGNRVNDGLGDDLRTAFEKVNANFTSLEASLTITASNIGLTGEGVFKQKNGSNLEFRNLIPGHKIQLEGYDDAIRIVSTQQDAFTSITTNSGVITANEANLTDHITIQGGQGARNIVVTADSETGVIEVDSVLDLNRILLTMDFGPADGAFENPIQVSLAAANIDFGTTTAPGRMSLDFGAI